MRRFEKECLIFLMEILIAVRKRCHIRFCVFGIILALIINREERCEMK